MAGIEPASEKLNLQTSTSVVNLGYTNASQLTKNTIGVQLKPESFSFIPLAASSMALWPYDADPTTIQRQDVGGVPRYWGQYQLNLDYAAMGKA